MTIVQSVRHTANQLGPTWLAGAIAAGPATMASLLSAGAGYGYNLLWVVILSALLGATGQYLAARVGLLTGEGIVTTVERRLGGVWAWVLVLAVILAAGFAQLVIMRTVADVSALIATEAGVGALGDPRMWGIFWAIVLAVGIAGGGYRVAEWGAKLLVSIAVLAFVASLFVIPIDVGAIATGLVPQVPVDAGATLVSAGVLGGAVHITLLTMQSYTMRARGWGEDDLSLARVDIGTSMLLAFGIFSLAVFVVAASVFQSSPIPPDELNAVTAARALGPIAGTWATWLFLLGLLGAAVTTLGGNTVVPPYLLADKLDWETDVSDGRFRGLLAVVALASAGGAFIEGALFPLLVLVLAFGLFATPFAIVLVLVLLAEVAPSRASVHRLWYLAGLVVLIVAVILAAENVPDPRESTELLDLGVFAFALCMALATVGVAVTYLRSRMVAR